MKVPKFPRPSHRWRTIGDALADQDDQRTGKPMSRFVLPGHKDYDEAQVGVSVVWMTDAHQLEPVNHEEGT